MCNNWALDKSSVKCHLIRMHAQEWYGVAEAVAEACKAHKQLFVRDTECSLCLKKVYGVERHALQCPVLFQACFMNCLAKAPSVMPNIWLRLKVITEDHCKSCLQGTLQVTQEVAEALNRFCALCARQNKETPIMDIQAWRKHLQHAHGVSKTVLTTKFHEQAALVSMSRPCTFCRMPFQKSPNLRRSKCLPLAQLLSVQHGYDGVGGDANCGSVGAVLSNGVDGRIHTRSSKGSRDDRGEDEASKIPKAGERGGKGSGRGSQTPGSSRGRRCGGPDPGITFRAQHHPHTTSEARPSAQSAGSGQDIRTLLHDHGHVDRSHAEDSDQPLQRDQYTKGSCTTTLRAALLTSLWLEMEARLNKFEQDPAAIKVMVDQGLFLEAPNRWAYTAWNPQEKKAMITDQPHLSSDELKAAIKTLKAAAMTDGVIRKFAPMQKLGENITAQAVVFTLVLSTRARAERVHTEMTKLINSAATSLIGLRLRPERLQLSPLAKALAGPRS